MNKGSLQSYLVKLHNLECRVSNAVKQVYPNPITISTLKTDLDCDSYLLDKVLSRLVEANYVKYHANDSIVFSKRKY